ncbi:ferredoxin family protein [Alicyclobacillus acidoterrestris]|uniref:Ferredoxin family protein n=1 Tax=Alicyclobacillus acidoterrestris (strain ATCC 49025 / DSM 3922 / CIP 106132 / NCIMB 13137 / GD3B) TaxID=1356854 RepID=T0BL27_ALIAG|nr:ferredoxin family protein [Alicyclobacillus acidoterrestris]EPZ44693.1 hypothetical protein N007_10675 [Alicyclobacillus acidoterrestris ATCC 49025]UNO50292.1 ferredoxin family protein [Alicyclobacillus acidoterrestris]
MIELVSNERCIKCGICVKVCPTDVFDMDENSFPTIARQDDCQTCFMCEAYCPVDALFVSPFADEVVTVNEKELISTSTLGSWRRTIGWGKGRTKLAAEDTTPFIDRILPR